MNDPTKSKRFEVAEHAIHSKVLMLEEEKQNLMNQLKIACPLWSCLTCTFVNDCFSTVCDSMSNG